MTAQKCKINAPSRNIKCVEKVVVFYIFLDVSCEKFAM